jgi:hypothetical protein
VDRVRLALCCDDTEYGRHETPIYFTIMLNENYNQLQITPLQLFSCQTHIPVMTAIVPSPVYLTVESIRVGYPLGREIHEIVHGLSFSLLRGEIGCLL